MVEQRIRQTAHTRRLNPPFLDVKLDEGDGLKKFPRNGLWHHGTWLCLLLANDEPHLGRRATTPRAPHALEKGTDRERRVYLERALKTAYVYAQLKG